MATFFPLPKQQLLPDHAVYKIANKYSTNSLKDPARSSIYLEQFVAAIEHALLEAQELQKSKAWQSTICSCGAKGPHVCPHLNHESRDDYENH